MGGKDERGGRKEEGEKCMEKEGEGRMVSERNDEEERKEEMGDKGRMKRDVVKKRKIRNIN